jgi:mannose-6-phosphate isomerase-like protein (cupin superfamily)
LHLSQLLEERSLNVIRSREFTAGRAWDAIDIARIDGASVRLHWTNLPYQWHVNDGEEVFVVLDGIVDMHYREVDAEKTAVLHAGDIFFAGIGCAHVAHPRGEARILVIEKYGSI